MRLLKGMVMGLVVTGFMVLLSSASFADEGHHGKDKIKLLNDSAAALAKSNPDLAASLTKYANEEAAKKQEKGKEKKELEGAQEDQMKARRAEHMKLFKDSAAALEKSNPDLAKRMTKMADHMAKRMENKEGKEDKEEAGEKEENQMKDKK